MNVVFAGVVGHRKGVDLLYAAWPSVVQSFADAQLHILGPVSNGFSQEVHPGVVHYGAVDERKVLEVLQTGRIAILPSRHEAMPMFVIEALASGCALVVSSVGALPAMADGAGICLQELTSDCVATALISILGDNAVLDSMATAGRSRYDQAYSAEKHEEALRALYLARPLDTV